VDLTELNHGYIAYSYLGS